MKSYQMYVKKLSMIIVLSLSISLVFSPLVVFASNDDSLKPVMTFDENGDIHLNISGKNIVYTVRQVLVWSFSQVGAIVKDHDFEQFLKNDESYLDFWNENNISVDNDGNIVLSDALVAYLKDMILQYQIETSGFIYYPTVSYKDLSAALFPSNAAYGTVKNLCEEHGLVAFTGMSYGSLYRLWFYPFSSTELAENSFVWEGTYDSFLEVDSTVSEAFLSLFNNETWQYKYFKCYSYDCTDTAITADGNYTVNGQGMKLGFYTPIKVMTRLGSTGLHNTHGSDLKNYYKSSLISSDGRKIKIYMGLDSFKNNTAGTRSVYLTEQFYDDTITSLAINFKSLAKFQEAYYKEMLKAINNSGLTDKQYNDLLEALQAIEKKEGMTEDELARILQQFADQIADALNSGSGSGSGSESGGGSSTDVSGIESLLESISSTLSSGLSGISDTIAAWGASIEAMLEEISLQVGDISWQLGEMTQEEFTGKMDNTTDQLFEVFSESGEILKTKFPFCIPWDIHSLLAKLGGAGIPQQAALYSLDDRPVSGVWNPTPTGRPVEQWVSSAEEEKTEAPKFEIPFVIESAGISDTLVIDLKYFNAVSKVSRVMFTLVFCGVLIKLTFPVVGFINEFVNGN